MKVDNLILKKSLGKGSFGEVFLTVKENGTELYATKRMNRAEYEKPQNYKRLANEISILQRVKHPNIVKLIELKKTKSHIYIVTEFCNGGSLYENLNKYLKTNKKPFTEEIVQYLMRQILSAINYLHKNKIIHRDLKLDNILTNFPTENDKINNNMLSAQVKIIDFGFATRLKSSHQNLTNTILGTPSNMEPHMLRNMEKNQPSIQGYDEKVDIWSLGTLCYEMMVGNLTFFGRNMDELYKKVKIGNYKIPLWLSKEAVSFLNGMLQYDTNRRLSSDDLLKHEFLTKNVKDFQPIETDQLKSKIQGNVMKVNIRNNDTVWGIFNEKNDIDDNKPLNEESFSNHIQTMPNIEVSEKMMNNFDNKINLNNNNDFTSFAKVKVIEDSNTDNNLNNNIINNNGNNKINNIHFNNKKIISTKSPRLHVTYKIPNNKPTQIPQTANPSSNGFHRLHTLQNKMINNTQNINQINEIQNDINNINFGHPFKPQQKEKNPEKLKRQFTAPTDTIKKDQFSKTFNNQPYLPNASQMEVYCRDKNTQLSEFF